MVAYATCIFLKAERDGKVTCQLIQARSRAAPLRKVSMPRLELLACNIGAILADTVKKNLRLEDIETFFWSDSMDSLYWIRKEDPWTIFVSNRVDEIRRLSEASDWKFVPGTQNLADLPSGGCTVKTPLKRQWHEGPSWFKESRENWLNFDLVPDEKIVASSKKIGKLSVEKLIKAELKILKRVQEDSFQGEKLKSLKFLSIFTDANGLLRIKTKILMREDNENFKVPIILPSDHHVLKSLILHKRKELGHPGVQSLMVALKEDYWILKTRRTVKKVMKTCITCQRFNVKRPEMSEGILPEDRVKNASIFEVIGVDVTGPSFTKDNKKVWIAIFTCVIYRAVHLELLTSISTDNFILAIRRFIVRRGRPSIIYSDYGTNFIGTNNSLKNINLERLKTTFSPILWRFLPPTAPWWGGFFERLIGLLKRILRKVLGHTSLNYQEIETVLCDCESQLNSRPLTYVSDDPDDLCPLTPDLFLKDTRTSSTTDLDRLKLTDKTELNKRLAYRRRLMTDLRARFRSEYLSQLHHRLTVRKPTYHPKVKPVTGFTFVTGFTCNKYHLTTILGPKLTHQYHQIHVYSAQWY
ncbi:uncharacterized protein [Parasteatoda tepidariorum]|uniref:uncharacterized protein n=1 Tax=Parasteatoda tepidariorum TaxID=114398 RepID=UPI0039BC8FF1